MAVNNYYKEKMIREIVRVLGSYVILSTMIFNNILSGWWAKSQRHVLPSSYKSDSLYHLVSYYQGCCLNFVQPPSIQMDLGRRPGNLSTTWHPSKISIGGFSLRERRQVQDKISKPRPIDIFHPADKILQNPDDLVNPEN